MPPVPNVLSVASWWSWVVALLLVAVAAPRTSDGLVVRTTAAHNNHGRLHRNEGLRRRRRSRFGGKPGPCLFSSPSLGHGEEGTNRGSSSGVDPAPDAKERAEMRDLIIGLSLEGSDLERRGRVEDVFRRAAYAEEAAAAATEGGPRSEPSPVPKRFAALFDEVLAEVGGEVQRAAQNRFLEKADEEGESKEAERKEGTAPPVGGVAHGENGTEAGDGGGPRWKTPEESQLWALVDVMVQSKTIVKRAEGKLGSKGSFQ